MLAAQSDEDKTLIKQARSQYYAQSSRPAYIACDALVDWDAYAKDIHLSQTPDHEWGLQQVKAMKIHFVTRSNSHTKVTVGFDPRLDKQRIMVSNHIATFFATYWKASDGSFFPSSKIAYEVTRLPDGYTITAHPPNGTTETVRMDNSLVILSAEVESETSIMKIKPQFKRENDGLLHLEGVSMDREKEEPSLRVDLKFDYQETGGFIVPLHFTFARPGDGSYTYTFSNCSALNKANSPAERPEDESPR